MHAIYLFFSFKGPAVSRLTSCVTVSFYFYLTSFFFSHYRGIHALKTLMRSVFTMLYAARRSLLIYFTDSELLS